MPTADVAKALRKLGLRSGDLRTAKMSDADIEASLKQRGWDQQALMPAEQFQQLAAATLFQKI